jgi:hypothetical protein
MLTRVSANQNEIIVGPWIEALVRRYQPHSGLTVRPKRLGPVFTALVAVGGVLSPMLLRLDHAAYPSDPEQQRVLQACERAAPTFVRFFASDRAACYERFLHPVDGRPAVQRE